jgi:hypothetical protein
LFKDVSVEANQQRQLYAAAASVGIGDDLNAFIFNCSALLFVLQIFLCCSAIPNQGILTQLYFSATAFHAPVGGVLFSIEVTGSLYFVNNYWKAFVASVSGMLCVELLQSSVR